MQAIVPFLEKLTRQIRTMIVGISRKTMYLAPYLDASAVRLVVFLGLLGYIGSKSLLSPKDDWHTSAGFIILGLGLALIFRVNDKWGLLAALVILTSLTLSPLYWRMKGMDTDGFSIAGVLPSSDAGQYFTGALRILYGENISAFAARRPLFVTFLSVILFLTGQDLAASLIVLAIIVAIAILLLATEVKQNFGVMPSALVAVIMIYCYAGRFAGKFLTEQLGIPLGILALTLLLRGLRLDNFKYVALGLFTLTIALNARAGALFVLPMLVLWGAGWSARAGFSIRKFFILAAIVASGFFLNHWIFESLAAPGSVPFGNFGSTLYGMATGYRGWRFWYAEYPGASEAEAFRISLELILASPDVFLSAVLRAYQDFLNPQYFFSFLYIPADQSLPAVYLLCALSSIGLWRVVQNRRTLFFRMMLFVFAGILFSVPFAPPPDDAIRAMTATTSFLALLSGCAFINFRSPAVIAEEIKTRPGSGTSVYFANLLLLMAVTGWMLVRGALKIPEHTPDCNPGEQAVTMVLSPKSYFNVVKNNQSPESRLPNLRRRDLLENLSNFPPNHIWGALRRVQPEFTVMQGLNLADPRDDSGFIWLVAPTESVRQFNGANYFCARSTGNPELDGIPLLLERSVENNFTTP